MSLTLTDAPQDEMTQAEGYRFLSRLVRASLENFVESGDVLAPTIAGINIKLGKRCALRTSHTAHTHILTARGKQETIILIIFTKLQR